jgi:hypothetical protein
MSVQKNVEWLRHRTEQYRSITNDMCEAIEDFDKVEKIGQDFLSVDPLKEIDIGDGICDRTTSKMRGFVSQDHIGGFSTKRECANTHK